MEHAKTDPSELKPAIEEELDLESKCFLRLREMLSPGVHPSIQWVESLTKEDLHLCLKYASAVIVYEPGNVVPPAPPCLKRWAATTIPSVTLVFPEGTNSIGPHADQTLEMLHDRIDAWYRRVAVTCGAFEDGEGPFPRFSVELGMDGFDPDNEDAPLIKARIRESTTELI